MPALPGEGVLQWVPATLDGVWRGAFLTVVVALVMLAWRRSNAASRFVVWWCTLVLVATLPVRMIRATAGSQDGARGARAVDLSPTVRGDASSLAFVAPDAAGAVAAPAAAGRESAAEVLRSTAGSRQSEFAFRGPVAGRRALAVPAGVAATALSIWAVVTAIALLRLALQSLGVARLRRRSVEAGDAWRADAARLSRRMALDPIEVRLSHDVSVPVTAGLRHPTILVPCGLELLDDAAREQVLAHEIAHVRRRDQWTNLAQRFVEIVLFFHPACLWITRRLRLERELACDDWVLTLTGATRGAYARLLVGLGEAALVRSGTPSPVTLSMAAHLRTRVQQLLASDRRSPPRAAASHVVLLTAVALIAASATTRAPVRATLQRDAPSATHAAEADPTDSGSLSERDTAAAARAADSVLRALTAQGFRGTVLVAMGGEVVLHQAYGDADPLRGVPGSRRTLHNAGAFAKTLTAAAILALEQDGRLKTTDPVARYLGPFPGVKAQVTIHHLLTHTGGVAQRFAPVFRDERDAFLRAIKDAPPENAPGAAMHYTDFGHALLAAVVEVVTGESYEGFVRRRLLVPAGIANEAGFEPEFVASSHPRFREFTGPLDRGEPVLAPRPYRWGRRGAMGAVASVEALYRWTLAMEDDRVLDRAAREKLFARYLPTGRGTSQGYGWETGTSPRGTPFQQRLSGWPGNSVEIYRSAADDVTIVLAGNLAADWVRPNYLGLVAASFPVN